MNRDFKKENQGKKSRSYLHEFSINPRKAIVDHPREGEEEVVDAEDSPKTIKKKMRGNRLTSQKRLSVTISRRWVTLPMNVI